MQRADMSENKAITNKTSIRRNIFLSLLFYFISIGVISVLLILCLSRKQFDLKIGSPAPVTISATEQIVDRTATNVAQQKAEEAVADVLHLDTDLIDKTVSACEDMFSVIISARSEAEKIRSDTAPVSGQDDRSWQLIISQEELNDLFSGLPFELPESSLGYYLLSCSPKEMEAVQEFTVPALRDALMAGITESGLDETKNALIKPLQTSKLSSRQKQLGELIYRNYLIPTYTVDEEATAKKKSEAAGSVIPVTVKKGALIVNAGETVSASQYELCVQLGLVRGEGSGRIVAPAAIFVCLIFFIAMIWSSLVSNKEIMNDVGRSGLLTIILVLSAALQFGAYHIDPRLQITSFPIILISTLYPRSVAEKINIMLSVFFGLLAGGRGAGIIGYLSVSAIIASLLGGECAILLISRPDTGRRSVLSAGLADGVVSALTVMQFGLLNGSGFSANIIFSLMMLLCPLVMSALTIGVSATLERMFDITSNAGLRELTASDHPLLQKLLTTAPGTYHHALMVATLAENASRSIGANALLARAGALFHDVGKIKHPSYFSENQNGYNIHDEWAPEKSAQIIIAHVSDAESFLKKAGIPADVRKIVSEHHGTTLVAYFYHKACQASVQAPIDESTFRYPGPASSTRESVIVMLADSCEAAVRSLGNTSKEAVIEMIRKVIRVKMDDGQFANAPITLAELNKIEKSFIATFSGSRHERISYPNGNAHNKNKEEERQEVIK